MKYVECVGCKSCGTFEPIIIIIIYLFVLTLHFVSLYRVYQKKIGSDKKSGVSRVFFRLRLKRYFVRVKIQSKFNNYVQNVRTKNWGSLQRPDEFDLIENWFFTECYSWKNYLYRGRWIGIIVLLFPKTFENKLFPANFGKWCSEFCFARPEQLLNLVVAARPYPLTVYCKMCLVFC